MLYRAEKIIAKGKLFKDKEPFKDHPRLTEKMNGSSNMIVKLFFAGCIFIQSEGVGFMIYFTVSAMMDNYAIFFVGSTDFCQYVKAVALYSLALVTFLPNCIIAIYIQDSWYDKGKWIGKKTAFVFVMVVVTVTSFIIRLKFVYSLGWAQHVYDYLHDSDYKLIAAVVLPPCVDGIQAMLLVASGLKDHTHTQAREVAEPLTDFEDELTYDALLDKPV